MKRLIFPTLLSCIASEAVLANLTPAPVMLENVSSDMNDYNLSVSDDGSTMVFARSGADYANAKIMEIHHQSGAASDAVEAQPIWFSDQRYRDSDPWLTPDGLTLYFISDRPTASRPAKRDLDIWRSEKKAGLWSAPEHLGDSINGPGEELGPELHDGVLYFASSRKGGRGGLDIYAARPTATGFDTPEPLSAPINSGASEGDFTLSRDGMTALFWRQLCDRGLLYISRRAGDGAWSVPEPLPDSINVGPFNFTPALSPDGARLTFSSMRLRAGQAKDMADIYEVAIGEALEVHEPVR